MSPKSVNDQLFDAVKALPSSSGSGSSAMVPFQGYGGGGWGSGAMYSSMDSWDRTLDSMYGWGGGTSKVDWSAKVGDLRYSSLIMSAVRFLGNVLPESPLQVKENKKGGKNGAKGESTVVDDHPMTKLWERPNPYYAGSTLRKGIAFSWVMRSEAYILKMYSNAKTVKELWYEPPWSIRPVWPIDGSAYIAYYEVFRNGTWMPVAPEQVIHLRDGIDPYNQRIGLSGAAALMREFFGDSEAANYYANIMGGSGMPPFFVTLDPGMTMKPEDMEKFRAELLRRTTGDRKGEPMVIKGGKPTKLGFSPRELDLRESRYMAEERFCAVMGIPAVVLELGSGMQHSIYNNVKQAMERAYYSYIIPLLRHLEEELTVQLLADFESTDADGAISTGRYLKHDLSKVQALQDDVDAKAKRVQGLYDAEIIMRSEARSEMNYGASDGNDDSDVDKVFKSDVAISKRESVDAAGNPVGGAQPPAPGTQQPQQPKRNAPPNMRLLTDQARRGTLAQRRAAAKSLRALKSQQETEDDSLVAV
jgi:HK97 family phage portal protein